MFDGKSAQVYSLVLRGWEESCHLELLGCIAEHICIAGLVADSTSVPSWITAGSNSFCAVCQLRSDVGWLGRGF